MAKFSYQCSCGDTKTVEAPGRDDALIKFKEIMNEDAIKKHYEDRHPGEEAKSVSNYHAMIDYETVTV